MWSPKKFRIVKTILLILCIVIWGVMWVVSSAVPTHLPHAFLLISRTTFILFVLLLLVDTTISFEISFNDKKNEKE